MISKEQLDAYRQRAKIIERKNAINDDEWYETIHQYYPELVEELLSELEKIVNSRNSRAENVIAWLESLGN